MLSITILLICFTFAYYLSYPPILLLANEGHVTIYGSSATIQNNTHEWVLGQFLFKTLYCRLYFCRHNTAIIYT